VVAKRANSPTIVFPDPVGAATRTEFPWINDLIAVSWKTSISNGIVAR